jgi:ribosomal protein S27AE
MICAFDDCKKQFEPHRHNQKYCCSDCCKQATNKRVRSKYYDTKQRLQGKKRICVRSGCKTILSRYTDDDTCGKCYALDEAKEIKRLKRMFK